MSYYPPTHPCPLLLSLLLIAKRRRGTIDRSFVRSSCFGRQLAGIPAKEPRPTKIIQRRWKGSPVGGRIHKSVGAAPLSASARHEAT